MTPLHSAYEPTTAPLLTDSDRQYLARLAAPRAVRKDETLYDLFRRAHAEEQKQRQPHGGCGKGRR